MSKFNKDMTIGEVLRIDMNAASVLMEIGMHCLGCPASQGDTGRGCYGAWDSDRESDGNAG